MTTKYQKYGVPYSLTIEEFKYTYKEYHPNNDLFTYRCIHRSCKAYIKIKKNEIDTISDKSDNKKIYYELFNKHDHNKGEIISVEKASIKSNEDEEKLAITLPKQNIAQPLQFHTNNLRNNKIKYSFYKIKNLLQRIRERRYSEK